ncbi:hypothetical protein ACKKBF_B38470 [Auxenochlorella protothecoides x Auxenochlorella symbiontica]
MSRTVDTAASIGYDKLGDASTQTADNGSLKHITMKMEKPELCCKGGELASDMSEAWEDCHCLCTIWLGASVGTLLISMYGCSVGMVAGFLGVLGFSIFQTPHRPYRPAGALGTTSTLAACTAILASIITGLCLGYLVVSRKMCNRSIDQCDILEEALMFNTFWFGFFACISMAVFRETHALADALSMEETELPETSVRPRAETA